MTHKIIGICISLLFIVTALPVISASNIQTIGGIKDSTHLGLHPNPLASKLIGIKITAKVTVVTDPDNLLGGAIHANDTITGKYIYDSTTPDNSSDPNYGVYIMTSAPCGFEIQTGGFSFKTNSSNGYFTILIYNNYFSPPCDEISMYSLNNLPLSNGLSVNYIGWDLVDTNYTALSSDALPVKAPVIADWEQPIGLQLMGSDPENPYMMFHIYAEVTKATKNTMSEDHGADTTGNTPMMIKPFLTTFPFVSFWEQVLERFPHAFPVLRYLMG